MSRQKQLKKANGTNNRNCQEEKRSQSLSQGREKSQDNLTKTFRVLLEKARSGITTTSAKTSKIVTEKEKERLWKVPKLRRKFQVQIGILKDINGQMATDSKKKDQKEFQRTKRNILKRGAQVQDSLEHIPYLPELLIKEGEVRSAFFSLPRQKATESVAVFT